MSVESEFERYLENLIERMREHERGAEPAQGRRSTLARLEALVRQAGAPLTPRALEARRILADSSRLDPACGSAEDAELEDWGGRLRQLIRIILGD